MVGGGDNWEGDRDLDEYKGQDWRGAVFDGKHGYDEKYRGVGNYGSGGYSGGGSYGGGGHSYSHRGRNNKKLIPAIIIPVLTLAVLFYFVNPLDFLSEFEDSDADKKQSSETSSLQKSDTETAKEFTDCQLRSNGKDLVEVTCNGSKSMHFLAEDSIKTSIQNNVILINLGGGKYSASWHLSNGDLVVHNLVLASNAPEIEKTKTTMPKLDLPEIKIEVPKKLPKIQLPDVNVEIPEITHPSKSQTPHSELIQYALARINQDRVERGLNPVLLSNNQAAQIHADDVFAQRSISHWMSNGEKPYMTYTRYGGFGSVSQNVAVFECIGYGCNADPISQIDNSEHDMIYNDAASEWGHRDNILRPYHTHVSIGISYNDNFFVMVQNFEDDYLSENPIQVNNGYVQIRGELKSGIIHNIGIFYDPLPSTSLYSQHKNDGSYGLGDLIAVVAPPLGPNSYYEEPTDYRLIVADTMTSGNSVFIDFDMSQIMTQPGVYTIGVWLKDGGQDFLITNYSVLNE